MNKKINQAAIDVLSAPAVIESDAQYVEPAPQPEPKRSFWGRVGNFFKKAWQIVKPILSIIGTLATGLNAISRFRNSGSEGYAYA